MPVGPDALGNDEVQVWCVRTANLSADLLTRYEVLLDADEVARVRRLKFERDRVLQLAAHALLRVALAAAADHAANEWRFVRTENGKPKLAQGLLGPSFNLTHTPGLAACALSWHGDVGIDAEHDRSGAAPMELTETVFTSREQTMLKNLPSIERARAFFDLWTLKEAAMKAVGLGLALEPQRLHATIGQSLVEAEQPGDDCLAGNWSFAQFPPTESHHLAVALRDAADVHRIRWREVRPLDWEGSWKSVTLNRQPVP